MLETTHVNKLIRRELPDVHWMRVENCACPGTPDLNGCYNSKEVWIESKIISSPGGRKIPFRPSQLPWLKQAALLCRRVFVLVRRGDDLRLWHCVKIDDLVRTGWDTHGTAWEGRARAADWEKLQWRLFL